MYPCNTGVSTNNAYDFVFQIGGDTGNTLQSAGSGSTLIQSTTNGEDVYSQYQLTSNPLGGHSFIWNIHGQRFRSHR